MMTEDVRLELGPLHDNILYIAVEFDRFCAEHGIEYFLLGGTAIGAMRHNGFIPWDDDFDVCLTYENYHKFLRLWNDCPNNNIYLQKENSKEWPLFFSKLRLNESTYVEKEDIGKNMHNGIYIDLMCLNKTFDNLLMRYMQYIAAKLLSAAAVGRRGYLSESVVKRVVARISRIIIRGVIKKFLLYFVQILNDKGMFSSHYSHFFGRAKFTRAYFPVSILGKGRRVKFENYEFIVMENVEEYLISRFGPNVMNIPDASVLAQFPAHCISYSVSKNIKGWNNKG